MSQLLQVQQAADEEAARRFGPDYIDHVRKSSYAALADRMLEDGAVTEEIINPDADNAGEYDRHRMRRHYRYSVWVGSKPDAQALVDARQQGQREAMEALKSLLQKPNDYEGELRGYLLRYLGSITPEIIALEVAEMISGHHPL